ncbi:hypothetical protein [Streptomyces sp. t39]|uniref:hypothetical protein n=1 Tax=Streptomyces sp. t39 TaxID=1828156 RepID=UPI0011CDCD85|nr:hypothetical protein [Streptomyces sp. t39]TXS50135.1 hypothetical protein EAO77_27895 [Streptomyces sp. t39]
MIDTSSSLAHLMNTHQPATPEDAAEGPLDWTGGLWVEGTLYDVDTAATTATTLVLTNGAAITLSPAGSYCGGRDAGCEHVRNSAVTSMAAHWTPADYESWGDDEKCEEDCRDATCGVIRDNRLVTMWDGESFSETTAYDTVEDAKAAYARGIAEFTHMSADLNRHAYDDED